MATPPLLPVSDIVSAPSTIDIKPASHDPSRLRSSPLVGGLTRDSSGWILEQW
jgi:hypothetical protein